MGFNIQKLKPFPESKWIAENINSVQKIVKMTGMQKPKKTPVEGLNQMTFTILDPPDLWFEKNNIKTKIDKKKNSFREIP